jgi:hypothetical protein
MPALTIHLPEAARLALEDLAEIECRSPRDQAAFLVLQGLRAAATATATPTGPRLRRDPPRDRKPAPVDDALPVR